MALSLTLLTGLGMTAAASPAAADVNGCLEGWVCAWEHPQYAGEIVFSFPPPGVNDGQCRNIGIPGHDRASSFINLSQSYTVRLYIDNNCEGGEFVLGARVGFPNLGGTPWDDRISSFRVG